MLRLVEAEMLHAHALVNTLMREGVPAAINQARTGRKDGRSFLMITTLDKLGEPFADMIQADEITAEKCETFFRFMKERHDGQKTPTGD